MKLWLLERGGDYDENNAAVIRAETEEEARQIADRELIPRDKGAWISSKDTTCEVLKLSGEVGIVFASFQAG